MLARLGFLGAMVEAIDHASHHVRWDYIGALAADVATRLGVFHMLQLLEYIETLQHYHQLLVQECANQAGIPHEIIGIQLLCGIFATGIEIEIIGQI